MANVKPVFLTNFFEQKKTVETLSEESRADADFYLFLGASAIITTLGLVLDSSIAVIGGMLVAPLLFPILSLGMGVTTSSKEAIARSFKIILQSIGLVLAFSVALAFLTKANGATEVMQLASEATTGHFLIAIVAGTVASFSWVKQDINATLPSIAVSVSLIPPLTTVGIGISVLDQSIIAGASFLFILNLLGITLASVIIFSLFGFSNMHTVQEKIIEKEQKEEEKANGEGEEPLHPQDPYPEPEPEK